MLGGRAPGALGFLMPLALMTRNPAEKPEPRAGSFVAVHRARFRLFGFASGSLPGLLLVVL